MLLSSLTNWGNSLSDSLPWPAVYIPQVGGEGGGSGSDSMTCHALAVVRTTLGPGEVGIAGASPHLVPACSSPQDAHAVVAAPHGLSMGHSDTKQHEGSGNGESPSVGVASGDGGS